MRPRQVSLSLSLVVLLQACCARPASDRTLPLSRQLRPYLRPQGDAAHLEPAWALLRLPGWSLNLRPVAFPLLGAWLLIAPYDRVLKPSRSPFRATLWCSRFGVFQQFTQFSLSAYAARQPRPRGPTAVNTARMRAVPPGEVFWFRMHASSMLATDLLPPPEG